MRELADYFRQFGFNIIPLGEDKRPILTGVSDTGKAWRFQWEDFAKTPQSNMVYKAMRAKPFWQDAGGVAATCGVREYAGGRLAIEFYADDDVPGEYNYFDVWLDGDSRSVKEWGDVIEYVETLITKNGLYWPIIDEESV